MILKTIKPNFINQAHRYSVFSAIGYVFVILLVTLIFTTLSQMVTIGLAGSLEAYQSSGSLILISTEVGLLLSYTSIILFHLKFDKQWLNFSFSPGFKGWHLIFYILLCALFIVVGLQPIFNLIPVMESQIALGEVLAESPILAYFLILVIAPVFEEIIFRGILLKGLLNRVKPTTAIILSSILFGVFHLTWTQLLSASLLGIIFGIIYYKSRTLIYPIIAHFLANFYIISFEVVTQAIPDHFLVSIVIGLISLVLIILYTKRWLSPKHPQTADGLAPYMLIDKHAIMKFYESDV